MKPSTSGSGPANGIHHLLTRRSVSSLDRAGTLRVIASASFFLHFGGSELVKHFLRAVRRVAPYRTRFFWSHALIAAVRRAIVHALDYPNEDLLLRVLAEFESMASQTYEGHRIAVTRSVAFDDQPAAEVGVELEEMWGQDFGKVLTGNLETILTVSSDGYVSRLRDLRGRDVDFAARAFSGMRGISLIGVLGRQVVVYLNRNGEILIFREKALRFAWRRGRWHHFVHRARSVRQMERIEDK